MMLLAWGHLNASSLIHNLRTLGGQPADANTKQTRREKAWNVWNAENGGREKAKGGDIKENLIICSDFLFSLCDSSCSCCRLSSSLWLLLLFIALLITTADSLPDLAASYVQQGAFKWIPNTVQRQSKIYALNVCVDPQNHAAV